MSIPKCGKLHIRNLPPLLFSGCCLSLISPISEFTLGLHGLHIAEPVLLAGVFICHKAFAKAKNPKKLSKILIYQ